MTIGDHLVGWATRTAVTCWSVGSQVGKQTGDPRRFVGRCRSQTVLMCSRVNIFWVDGGGGAGSWVECPGSKGGRLCPAPSLEPPPWRRGGAPPWYLYTSPATGYMAARPFHSLCPQSCGFVYSKPEGDRSGATHCQ